MRLNYKPIRKVKRLIVNLSLAGLSLSIVFGSLEAYSRYKYWGRLQAKRLLLEGSKKL